eukprot:3033312-Prymnesium_polylepis.3
MAGCGGGSESGLGVGGFCWVGACARLAGAAFLRVAQLAVDRALQRVDGALDGAEGVLDVRLGRLVGRHLPY